ncbi:sigma-70 family RNA polymerase sigma factor [Nonomuraea longispora]|uniref:Sigma-70 family RNA polymerase sigma factor n=1 Tax=Nonomuraea longispora TaxID=1848320 RepID=A0A4R4MZY3_9ACTN|nr:sigma-70 family RNA polymerase sigma factor [Nonomuraea longispora]
MRNVCAGQPFVIVRPIMGVELPQSDASLLQAARQGDAAAYGRLYERHVAAARAMARQLVRRAEAEDVVTEAFTKILDLVGRGGGPESGFRTYLLTVVRRTVHDRSKLAGSQAGEVEEYDPEVPFVDPALAGLERSLIARAYLSLPERWRAVLWHTQVERCKPAAVAPLLGLSANGVAALAYRAREGLRRAYLQMHLGAAPPHDCRPVLGKMGAYVSGGLTRRDARAVERHVDACEECHGVILELTDVNRGLRVLVGPLIAGPMFGRYAAALARPEPADGAGGLPPAVRRLWRARRRQPVVLVAGVALTVAAAASLWQSADGEPDGTPATATVAARPSEPVRAVRVPPHGDPERVPPHEKPGEVPPRGGEPERVPPLRVEQTPEGTARLRATVDVLGALVRAHPGIVGLRLRNHGERPSEDLTAHVTLPPGVTLMPPARRGSPAVVGPADGWECRPSLGGARCTREPLAAGRATAVFLRVAVARRAPRAAGPAARIDAGPLRVKARGGEGVRATGAPARFAADGKVTVKAVGNALLSCYEESPGCEQARRRDGGRRDNDLWPMAVVDRDGELGTFASSGAKVSLPKGGRIVWAGLYWSAGGSSTGPIKFRPPGRRKYATIRPSHVAVRELPQGPVYHAFADVTGLAAGARKSGVWWAADAPMEQGASRHAGWSLVLVVADPAQPYSRAMVLDAATVVGGRARRVRLPLGGLRPAGTPARAALVAWEGDADLKGDKVSLGSGAMRPSGGDRDAANVFDGSSAGVAEMTFGVDVDTFSAELGADPGLTIATGKDAVLFGVAAISVRARS